MKTLKIAALAVVLVGAKSLPAMAEMAGAAALGHESYGVASWYGTGFKGSRTASGEKFDPKALTAAHPTLPFGTLVEVSRRDKKKSVIVVVTDRGPYVQGRSIDLSRAAARRLSMSYLGAVPVRMQVVGMTE
ncbi:Rare lipoprotein A precursor [Paramagnetospirillum magnetotacticum MS-1]|uniref:Endolytic peptidoglycan transglycosylase RlpA n=1 Tax=Paramagnetospirillum magnetotacticum MS-1 TaxID=272627 RepID=A0A0C2YV60_PARME|nr:septal ring lytic transglycosylase RlpA family protein [Paramagnetospirillum magnetotacticum]KIL98580.1 Rare lipoprotein A precursor [Paramagnetospirillum magnetotacticum MS-1]